MISSKKQPSRGFFDEQEQLEKLSKLKDPLEKLKSTIDKVVIGLTNLAYNICRAVQLITISRQRCV